MFGLFAALLLFTFGGHRLLVQGQQYTSINALKLRLPGRCKEGDFDCGESQCVPVARFHDGKPDCRNGADEACLLGQVKCGPYCVNPPDSLSCLLHPYCDNTNRAPQFCSRSKEKLCAEPLSFPCKGYGECVMWKWLLDGKKDCIDESDEDISYVSALEASFRCYYNSTGQLAGESLPPLSYPSFPSISIQPALPQSPLTSQSVPATPCIFCPPPSIPNSFPPNRPRFPIPRPQSVYPAPVPALPIPMPIPYSTSSPNPYPSGINQPQTQTTPRNPFATLLPYGTESTIESESESNYAISTIQTGPTPNLPSKQGLVPIDSHPHSTADNKISSFPEDEGEEEQSSSSYGNGGSAQEGDGFFPETTQSVSASKEDFHVTSSASSSYSPYIVVPNESSEPPANVIPIQTTSGSHETGGGKWETTDRASEGDKGKGQSTSGYSFPNKETIVVVVDKIGGTSSSSSAQEWEYGSGTLSHQSAVAPSAFPPSAPSIQPTILLPPSIHLQSTVVPAIFPTTTNPFELPFPLSTPSHGNVVFIQPDKNGQFPNAPIGVTPIMPVVGVQSHSTYPPASAQTVPGQEQAIPTLNPFNPVTQPPAESPYTVIQVLPGGGSKQTAQTATPIVPVTKTPSQATPSPGKGDEQGQGQGSVTVSVSTINGQGEVQMNKTTEGQEGALPVVPVGTQTNGTAAAGNETSSEGGNKLNACMFSLLEKARRRNPKAECDCPPGQIRMGMQCRVSNISTIVVNLEKVCGEDVKSPIDKQFLVIDKVREAFPFPACVRSIEKNRLLVNVLCDSCELEEFRREVDGKTNDFVIARTEAANSEVCSKTELSGCHEYADCHVDSSGLRYDCRCPTGTNDTSIEGRGRTCQGDPYQSTCVLIFGICLLTWMVILLGALFLLILFLSLCCRFCECCCCYNLLRARSLASKNVDIRKEMETSHIASLFADSLKKSATGASAMGSGLVLAEVQKQKKNKISKTPEMSQVLEIDSTQDTMAPSLDSRQSPQIYVGPNPMQLAGALRKQLSSTAILDRGETGSLPGTTQVDTPILDRGSAKSLPRDPKSILKESGTFPDLTKVNGNGFVCGTGPPPLVSSDSAPTFPNLRLPSAPDTSRADALSQLSQDTKTIGSTVQEDVHDEDLSSARSLNAPPTIWDTYKVLGTQYTGKPNQEGEKTPDSLEALIEERFPIPEPIASEDSVQQPRVNNNIPLPLEAVVSAADLIGGNNDSKTGEQVQSTTSRSDVRSARLAEMLGVTTIDSTTPSTSAETTTHQGTSNEIPSTSGLDLASLEEQMQGVTVPKETVEEEKQIPKGDTEILEEMARRRIELPLSPIASLAEKPITAALEAALASLQESEEKKKKEAETSAEKTMRRTSSESRKSTGRDNKKYKISHNQNTPSVSQSEEESGESSKQRKTKPAIFVPQKGRTSSRESSRFDATGRLKGKFKTSSTEESDPEVSFAQRLYEKGLAKLPQFAKPLMMGKMGKERPSYKQRHKRKSRIVRTLSSISEKSNELAAAEAALQEHDPMDAIMSCPSTTRLSYDWKDWKGATPKRKMADEIPQDWHSRYRFVSSPEIMDVTKRKSVERVDRDTLPSFAIDPINIDKAGRKKKHRGKSIEAEECSQGPSTSRHALGHRPSIIKRETSETSISRGEGPVYTRRTMTSRSEVHRRRHVPVKFHSVEYQPEDDSPEENLYDDRPPWDNRPFRESAEKDLAWETCLPPIAKPAQSILVNKSTQSACSSPRLYRKLRRSGSHFSLRSFNSQGSFRSGGGPSAHSHIVTPYFDSVKDSDKPPKENLWWARKSPQPS